LRNLETSNKNLITSVNKNNAAKNLATKLTDKQIILIGGEFLEGNLHALRNQINENCKNFASYLIVPELNHYAMEGLAHPKANQKDLLFLFIDSKLYHPRVQERINLTKEVIKKNKIKFLTHELASTTRLEQSLELLQFGSWTTFYLAMLNQVNPAKIPFVDWFKNNLK